MEKTAKRKLGGREATSARIDGDVALAVGKPDRAPPKGWRWRLLTDLARLESGHTPSRKRPEYWGGEIPWIGIRDATGNHGRTISQTNEYTNQLGIANSAARILPAGTVCLSRTASVGYVVVMGCPMATSQDFVNWSCGPDLSANFLKYALMAEGEALLRFASGSVHQTIYFPEVKSFYLATPPISEQIGIAEILGSLDAKIELNRQMNETLEAMAQALFRDWFVEFGPTGRKLRGVTDPVEVMGGLVQNVERALALAALFPAKLDQDGLPEGWKGGTLGDLAKSAGITVDPNSIEPQTPYIGLEHMPRKSIALNEWEAASKVTSTKAKFEAGQILFGKLRPYFHKVGVAPVDGVCSTDIVVLDAKTAMDRPLLTSLASSDEFVRFTDRGSTGTKMPRTGWANMKSYPLVKASEAVRQSYSDLIGPMLDRIVANVHENQALAATRDLLLPKLMSGEIRLSDAEDLMEAAQ
ncbi:restriction endonuclease subunit S [Rhizobium sp. BR 362]|uniref:restriction endonuclease subunit S n=1 Tax=Rhizobium sp. BR 362 TaxID=3040670 RepID=UPI002F40D52C